jgi:hypothetical protein
VSHRCWIRIARLLESLEAFRAFDDREVLKDRFELVIGDGTASDK